MSSIVLINNAGEVMVKWQGWGMQTRMSSAVLSNGTP